MPSVSLRLRVVFRKPDKDRERDPFCRSLRGSEQVWQDQSSCSATNRPDGLLKTRSLVLHVNVHLVKNVRNIYGRVKILQIRRILAQTAMLSTHCDGIRQSPHEPQHASPRFPGCLCQELVVSAGAFQHRLPSV
jgi:hypothetical protein